MSALTELYAQIANCHRCEIAKYRTNAVPGEGPEDAEIVFIGEAPGQTEDQLGRPFVGQAGKYLDDLLGLIGLTRQQVYITNVIKTRPPSNREPLPGEVQNCRPWLDRQLEIIRPKIIVTLGRYSLAGFLPNKTISQAHGHAQKKDSVIIYPMYHPAAGLHQASLKKEIQADMLKIPTLLAEARAAARAQFEPPPQQLGLFR